MLEQRIADRTACIGILGLGYVGLPLAAAFIEAGFSVQGFDTDPAKVEALERGESYLLHLGGDLARRMQASGRFEATSDFERVGEPDVLIICVPTPLGEHNEPDLTYIERSTEAVAKHLRKDQLVILESTTYPGTTRDLMGSILDASGLRMAEDYLLAYSPEREDPGSKDFETRTIPKLVGGTCERSGRVAYELYAAALESVHQVSSAEVAESAKLLENIFRAVNIAMVNELKVVFDAMGIDVWEVIDAASTKPFGFMRFTPGPGLGGHCIPIDPYYLTWIAKKAGYPTRFIELAGEINTNMPRYVVEKTMAALNEVGKPMKGSRILVLGLAYKPDVDDIRESPAIELMHLFRERHALVRYSDPHVPKGHRMRRFDLSEERSVDLSPETIADFDAVVVATNHAAFDWDLIAEHAKLVVDTRNALARRMDGASNYFKA